MEMLKIDPPVNQGRKKQAGQKEITMAVLDAVVNALVEGDSELLQKLRISPAMAKRFYSADKHLLADLILENDGALRVEFDGNRIEPDINMAYSTGLADLWRRQLVDLGATWQILNELGIGVTRHAFTDLMRTASDEQRQHYNGRPKAIRPDQIRSIHTLCGCILQPERLHPIEHLINTSHILNIRIVGIWRYLHAGSQSPHPQPCHRHMWIYQLFPEWDVAKTGKTRLPEYGPRFDYT